MDKNDEYQRLLDNAPSFASIADKYVELAQEIANHTRMEAQELAKIIQETHQANQAK